MKKFLRGLFTTIVVAGGGAAIDAYTQGSVTNPKRLAIIGGIAAGAKLIGWLEDSPITRKKWTVEEREARAKKVN